MMLRSQRKWNDLKDIVIYTYKESPTKLKLSLKNDTNIVFSWTNRTSLNDSIVVDRKTSATGTFSKLATLPNDAVTFYDSLLTPDKEYYYRLRTGIKDSIQLCSYPVMIKTTKPVYLNSGPKKPFKNSDFQVWPNPADSWVSVRNTGDNTRIKLEIFDMQGQIKISRFLENTDEIISLTDFSAGVYLFKLTGKGNNELFKLMVR